MNGEDELLAAVFGDSDGDVDREELEAVVERVEQMTIARLPSTDVNRLCRLVRADLDQRAEDKRLADALRWIEENAGDLLFLRGVGFRAYPNPPNKGCHDGRTPLEAIEAAMRAAGEDVG